MFDRCYLHMSLTPSLRRAQVPVSAEQGCVVPPTLFLAVAPVSIACGAAVGPAFAQMGFSISGLLCRAAEGSHSFCQERAGTSAFSAAWRRSRRPREAPAGAMLRATSRLRRARACRSGSSAAAAASPSRHPTLMLLCGAERQEAAVGATSRRGGGRRRRKKSKSRGPLM